MKKNLTGAVELPGFESGQTIILALIVIFTIVNASPECQTVTINTSIPVLIFFYDLYYEIHLPDYIILAKLPIMGLPGNRKQDCHSRRNPPNNLFHMDNLK